MHNKSILGGVRSDGKKAHCVTKNGKRKAVLFISKGTAYLLWGFKLTLLYETLLIKNIGSRMKYKLFPDFVIFGSKQ